MAFPHKTVKAPLRSLILITIIFALTWSSNSLVDAVASCHKDSDDSSSFTTGNEPSEVQPGASVTFWSPRPIELKHSSSEADDSATSTEKFSTTSLSDSITYQSDKPANEPALSTEDSSDTQPLNMQTTSGSIESITMSKVESTAAQPSDSISSQPDKPASEPALSTEDSSDAQPLNVQTTSGSIESVTMSKVESTAAQPSDSISSQPDKPASEPALSTEDSSDAQPLNVQTTSGSIESVTMSKVESTAQPSDSINSRLKTDETATVPTQASRITYGPPPCCHPAKSFPFVDNFNDDPCKIIVNKSGVRKNEMVDPEPELVKKLYDFLMDCVELLKRSVDDTLNNDLRNICREVSWPPVAKIPTQQDLELLSNGEIFFLYYSSLVNHTAYLNHMVYQLQNYDRTCSRDSIHASAPRLASDIRKVTCYLRIFILAVYDDYDDESFEKPTKEVLEVSLCDQHQCSRRALYDCLVVSSLHTIINQFAAFMEKPDPVETLKKLKPDIQKRFKRVLNHYVNFDY